MSTLVEAEIWTIARTDQGNAVLVRPIESDVAVPIFIGQLEAQSILIGLGSVPMPRPLTHDLFLNVLKQSGIKLDKIEITSLKDGTFFAQLVLLENDLEMTIDSRPSDAIALAVRNKCAVFIDESIVDEAGISVSVISEDGEPVNIKPNEMEKIKLEKKLQKLVETENYEEAAKIRDKLKKLEEHN